jgi:DNA polymerase (family X)
MSFNEEVAKLFFDLADAFELKGVPWKPQAYRKAAFAINSVEDVREIYKRGGVEELKKVPSIGGATAAKIEEYIKTGHIKRRDEMMGKLPEGITNIMELPGVGPSKAKRLYKELNIRTIDQLKNAAETGKIRGLDGFGEKSEKEILLAISLGLKAKDRQPIEEILPIADKLVAEIKSWPEVIKAEYAGSLRRKVPTVGDIDIIVSSKTPEKVTAKFAKLPQVKKVIAQGKTKTAVWLKNNFEADVRVVDDSCYGAALQYFTGPKNFNIKTRKIAIKKGYKLSEYGLFNRKTGERVAGKTEKEIFEKLGLPYIKPEDEREEFSKE